MYFIGPFTGVKPQLISFNLKPWCVRTGFKGLQRGTLENSKLLSYSWEKYVIRSYTFFHTVNNQWNRKLRLPISIQFCTKYFSHYTSRKKYLLPVGSHRKFEKLCITVHSQFEHISQNTPYENHRSLPIEMYAPCGTCIV